MNVTFLIGNGFDINCGLSCSYQDIYNGYVNKSSGDTASISAFKEDILKKPETWAAFEAAMNQYLNNFRTEEEFLSVIRDFKKFMIEHLKREEALFLARLKGIENGYGNRITGEMRESLNSFYEGISHNVSNQIRKMINESGIRHQIICFNYTQVSDALFRRSLSNPNIIHIHGILDDGPVLGMDNEGQLSKELPFETTNRFKREFIKPFFNQVYDSDRVRDAIAAINTSDVICVYGMSLGESDLTWKNSILDWLQTGVRHLFIYDYHYTKMDIQNAHIRLDIEEEAKEDFFKKNSIGILNRPLIRSKLHIRVGRNIFNINDVLQKVEKEQQNAKEKEKIMLEKLHAKSMGSMQGA